MTTVTTPQSVCLFGIGRRDVTPPVGIYHRMWGAATHDRAEGVHRPLAATAAVFAARDRPEERQAVLAIDHCLLMRREMELLTERITSATGLRDDEVVVTFSHTHAAGLMDLERAALPGGELIGPYLEDLAAGAAQALVEALGSLAPATVIYGRGSCSLAARRDLLDRERGAYVCGFDPSDAADDVVLVARVADERGHTVATVVDYACHPTTLAFANRLVSPDYPGAMRELVEAATGAPSLFLQGASGDLGPREGYVGDPAVADRNGRILGHAALAALEALPPPRTCFRYRGPVVSGATLGIWEHEALDGEALRGLARWERTRLTVPLPYRADLPTEEEARAELARRQGEEEAARAAGDGERAGEARALAERARRRLKRLRELPAGDAYPYEIVAWRIGGAAWIAFPGEPYSVLQGELRRRFPGLAIVVLTLAGGWGPSYLPAAETYGKGIYQEEIAVVERGSLERVIKAVAGAIGEWADRG